MFSLWFWCVVQKPPACVIMWIVCSKMYTIQKVKNAGVKVKYNFDVVAFEEVGLPDVICRK